MIEGVEPPPSWLTDLLLCRELRWSWDDLQEAPDWVVARARLWFDTVAQWRKSQEK